MKSIFLITALLLTTHCMAQIFIGEDVFKAYEKLSVRGKSIVDSLQNKGVAQYQNSYISNEPHWMKIGKKVERFWTILGDNVILYEYLLFRTKTSAGCSQLKETILK